MTNIKETKRKLKIGTLIEQWLLRLYNCKYTCISYAFKQLITIPFRLLIYTYLKDSLLSNIHNRIKHKFFLFIVYHIYVNRIDGVMVIVLDVECVMSWVRPPVGSNKRLLNWYLLLLR
jgi:hypothetical protein